MILDNRSDFKIVSQIKKALSESESVSIGPFRHLLDLKEYKYYEELFDLHKLKCRRHRMSYMTFSIEIFN